MKVFDKSIKSVKYIIDIFFSSLIYVNANFIIDAKMSLRRNTYATELSRQNAHNQLIIKNLDIKTYSIINYNKTKKNKILEMDLRYLTILTKTGE